MTDTCGMTARTLVDLEAGLVEILRDSPDGVLRHIVRRPAVDQRELVETASLDVEEGLVGDTWKARGSRRTADGSADPEAQITLMDARIAGLLAGGTDAWSTAGDQLFADVDLSVSALPSGSRIAIGDAELEISATPHTGCAKFAGRFGADALRFVSTPQGRALRLRGVNARIVRGGTIRIGDRVEALTPGST